MPPMPKIRSNTTITSSNSHALDSISEPIIFAFKKYSSLCTTTKNTSEATATYSDAPKLKIIITVLDTRLPATGTSPTTNAITKTVRRKGSSTPNAGRIR